MQSAGVVESEARATADIYGFLAAVLGSHPNERSARVLEQLGSLAGLSCPSGATEHALEEEYMALFVLPGPRYVAPYESVFRDRWLLPTRPPSDPTAQAVATEGLLMGESTLAVSRCFVAAGTWPEDDLPDLFANELRLLAHLWRMGSESDGDATSRVGALRREVRDQHLLQWVDELREKVEKCDRLGYYAAAMHIATNVLNSDRASDVGP